MKPVKLKRDFFKRPTLKVARELIGKTLVRNLGSKTIKDIITETEAYVGPNDLASHASRGRTKRTEVMFAKAGTAYVYMIYGMYFCFNVVTEKEDYPAAVLIRATKKVSGPGRLCKFFRIDKRLNREDIVKSKKIWIEDDKKIINSKSIKKTKRIGVDYAENYKDKLWRFVIK